MPSKTRKWPLIAGLIVVIAFGLSLFKSSEKDEGASAGSAEPPVPEISTAVEGAEESPLKDDDRFLREIVDRQEASTVTNGKDIAHQHVKRSWQGSMRPSLLELGEKFEANELTVFVMPTFEGDEIVIEIHRFERSRFGGGVLRGEVEGYPGSLVSLSQVGQSEAGSIHIPTADLVYEVRPGPQGTTIFSEIDTRLLGECLTCIQSPPPDTSLPTRVPLP